MSERMTEWTPKRIVATVGVVWMSLGAACWGSLIALINQPPWRSDLSGTPFGFVVGVVVTVTAAIATALSIRHLRPAAIWLTASVVVLVGGLVL